jgi:acetyl esterase/lipase
MSAESIFLIILYNAGIFFSQGIKRERNIVYKENSVGRDNRLDVYYPEDKENIKDVLVFIHGGSWNSGDKELYWWIGRNFASKNIVTAIVNYPLSPASQYQNMAQNCAFALKWVKLNIEKYGGNSDRIFVFSHSAGGHLTELINSDSRYFDSLKVQNPIRGVILNDPFGLDLHDYMTNAEKDSYYKSFIKTFTVEPEVWKKASPITYAENIKNPHLILIGDGTYPSIIKHSQLLNTTLQSRSVRSNIKSIKKKKHIPMITQMIFGGNKLYADVLKFMREN